MTDQTAALAAALAGAVRKNHTPDEWAVDALDLLRASGWAVTRATVPVEQRLGSSSAAPASFIEDWSDPAMDVYDAPRTCGCGHAPHWRECRGQTVGVIGGGPVACECRHRGPHGDAPKGEPTHD